MSADTDVPLLSVIIVSWRVPALLRDCLRSLFAEAERLDGDIEVFVVDNASGDETVDMVRREFPTVGLTENLENVGFGRANCQAYAQARGAFVLLLNPDTLVPAGALARLVERIKQSPDIAVLGCRLLNGDGTLQRWTGGRFPTLWNIASHYLFLDRLLEPLGLARSVYLTRDESADIDVDWVSGACLLLRRRSVPEPLFDPAYFMYGEDMDLCHRVKTRGGRVVYSPSASIVHFQGASMKQQQGDILLSSLKGLRSFYGATRGRRLLWAFDLITLVGFAARSTAYTLLSLARPDADGRARAASSRRHLGIAWRLVGR